MWRILLLMLIVVGFIFAITTFRNNSSATVLVPVELPADDGFFSEVGTLIFYPNNVKPVPYVFYSDRNGTTVSKALVFVGAEPHDFSSWTGARISVTGTVVHEHVVVSDIKYISEP